VRPATTTKAPRHPGTAPSRAATRYWAHREPQSAERSRSTESTLPYSTRIIITATNQVIVRVSPAIVHNTIC